MEGAVAPRLNPEKERSVHLPLFSKAATLPTRGHTGQAWGRGQMRLCPSPASVTVDTLPSTGP